MENSPSLLVTQLVSGQSAFKLRQELELWSLPHTSASHQGWKEPTGRSPKSWCPSLVILAEGNCYSYESVWTLGPQFALLWDKGSLYFWADIQLQQHRWCPRGMINISALNRNGYMYPKENKANRIERCLGGQECLVLFQQTQVQFPVDPSVVVGWLTASCNSDFWRSSTSFWSPWKSALTCMHKHAHTHIHTHA